MFQERVDFSGMDHSALDQKIKANAYRLFFAELAKRVACAEAYVAKEQPPSAAELKEIGASFHVIRGGAGFFGLDELASLAERGERFILGDLAKASDNIDSVRTLVAALSTCTQRLPKPD